MKIKFKAQQVEIVVEGRFGLHTNPAFAYKTDNYEVELDVHQLIDGIGDITEKLLKLQAKASNPLHEEFERELREMSRENNAEFERTMRGNGEAPQS